MMFSYLDIFLGDIVSLWPTLPLLFFWMIAPVVCLALWPRLRFASLLVCCAAALFFVRLTIYACWGLTIVLFIDLTGLSPTILSTGLSTMARLLEALGFCFLLGAVVIGRGRVSAASDSAD